MKGRADDACEHRISGGRRVHEDRRSRDDETRERDELLRGGKQVERGIKRTTCTRLVSGGAASS